MTSTVNAEMMIISHGYKKDKKQKFIYKAPFIIPWTLSSERINNIPLAQKQNRITNKRKEIITKLEGNSEHSDLG